MNNSFGFKSSTLLEQIIMKPSFQMIEIGATCLVMLTAMSIVHGNIVTETWDKIAHPNDNTTNEVTIYAESNFWGLKWTMAVSNCTDVPALLYKKASSIDTHGNCVILYGRQECEGNHVRIAPGTSGHSHLSEVDFDDTLASLRSCGADEGKHQEPTKEFASRKSRRSVFSDWIGKLTSTLSESEENSSQQNGGDGLQAAFGSLNINDIINRLQIPSGFSASNSLLPIRSKK